MTWLQSAGALILCLSCMAVGYRFLGWTRNRSWDRRHGMAPAE